MHSQYPGKYLASPRVLWQDVIHAHVLRGCLNLYARAKASLKANSTCSSGSLHHLSFRGTSPQPPTPFQPLSINFHVGLLYIVVCSTAAKLQHQVSLDGLELLVLLPYLPAAASSGGDRHCI